MNCQEICRNSVSKFGNGSNLQKWGEDLEKDINYLKRESSSLQNKKFDLNSK